MPCFEYICESCDILFERLLLKREDVKEFQKQHPCPDCGESAPKCMSAANFRFSGVSEGDPTKRGNSGFHDLDYPTLDKAIGRSAKRKWKEYDTEKKHRDQRREELQANAISSDPVDNIVTKLDDGVAVDRSKGLTTLSKARKQFSSD